MVEDETFHLIRLLVFFVLAGFGAVILTVGAAL